jgi:hypothetical protein
MKPESQKLERGFDSRSLIKGGIVAQQATARQQ